MKGYTIEQIAKMLQVHDRTVRKYIKSGEIKAVKIGTTWRIMESDLLEFLEKNKTGNKEEKE